MLRALPYREHIRRNRYASLVSESRDAIWSVQACFVSILLSLFSILMKVFSYRRANGEGSRSSSFARSRIRCVSRVLTWQVASDGHLRRLRWSHFYRWGERNRLRQSNDSVTAYWLRESIISISCDCSRWKAVAALASNPGDVYDYLEVVGKGRWRFRANRKETDAFVKGKAITNRPLPLIAVPTTRW